MWFLVNLPGNKLKIAVKSDRNSIAAECLNKVSKNNYRHIDSMITKGYKSSKNASFMLWNFHVA